MTIRALAKRAQAGLHRLKRCQSGLALVEMAYCTPILLTLTMGGAELANYATAQMRVSQLALQVSDNASRMGAGLPLAAKQITETMVNDVLAGAEAQANDLNLMGTQTEGVNTVQKARVIISDLEADPDNAGRYKIMWQRCRGGATTFASRYGAQGANNMTGMGPAGQRVTPPADTALMFVEVHYRYQPLFIGKFGFVNYVDIDSEAATLVRDDRDLTQVYNPDNVVKSLCTT